MFWKVEDNEKDVKKRALIFLPGNAKVFHSVKEGDLHDVSERRKMVERERQTSRR